MVDLERLKEGANSRMYMAQRLMRQRKFQEAALLFAAVVAEDPANADAFLSLGAAYGQMGQLEKAKESIEQAVKLNPTESKAHYNLGMLYLTEGDVDQSLASFRKAVAINPGYTEAHHALARILWRQQQCEEAVPHFKAFLDTTPENVESRINQAICHVTLGDYAEAWALLETGLDAFPQHPGIQDALVRVLSASRDADVRDGQRALTIAQALASAFPRTETLESLAMAYAEAGFFAEAIQTQDQAIQAARQQGLARWLDHLNANRNRYLQEQPCRTPWEAVIFAK